MARARRSEILKRVPLSEVKDNLSRYLRRAAEAPIIVTRHGRPAGVLIGFASEDDWFDYQLENDPRFVRRVRRARGDSGAAEASRSVTCESGADMTARRFNPTSQSYRSTQGGLAVVASRACGACESRSIDSGSER